MLRYALRHNLQVAIPPYRNEQFRYKLLSKIYLAAYAFGDFKPIKKLSAPKFHYNLTCEHGIYSAKGVQDLLGPDAKVVTVLREPLAQFISMWPYYELDRKFHMSLEHWLLKYANDCESSKSTSPF